MPHFELLREVNPPKTFRVASIMGKFDLDSNHIVEKFEGNIDIPEKWNIGLIVGPSGTGKTTIAKELFPDIYFDNYEYKAPSVVDDMPEGCTVEEISKAFNSVGFSSPPSWLKPYAVLSNGEKMRVDLARNILEKKECFLFDEFTSVVDRQVAKVGSFAIQKAIRRTDAKFIAVGCHYDVEDWLMPDWIFDTADMTFRIPEGQKKNRPGLKIRIYETKRKQYYWRMFARYHYLTHSHNNAARVYIMTLDNTVCGFCSVLPFPHPKLKNHYKGHRTVILPDYQGLGLGNFFVSQIAEILKKENKGFISTSSHPAIINARVNDPNWIVTRFGRTSVGSDSGNIHNKNKSGSTSSNRITVSFKYIG